jgi:hypothetical protein
MEKTYRKYTYKFRINNNATKKKNMATYTTVVPPNNKTGNVRIK